ncbi:O-antigen ligase family protein [Ferrimonas aestuarii]|uniref:O-antigen ligase-related domain-containing protein n=1 Tax=Ferrimonas aestuarii TaxID=2569539 RepID=A0A4U1BVR5_9GAMM|nr:O-antigen ligase family protein [Ferrimonas aestuarii]TKB57289.1 hypothetical protein FCL42_03140 [Ferrimonas aestuarii]
MMHSGALQPTSAFLLLLITALMMALAMTVHPVVLLAGWAVAIAMIALWRYSVWMCVAFALLSAFRLHELTPALLPLRLPQLFAMATLAVLMWQLAVTRQSRPFLVGEGKILLALFAVTTVGMLLASNRGLAMGYWSGSWIKVVLMCFAISWLLKTQKQIVQTGWLIIAAGAVVSLCALYNSVNGLEVVEGTRVTIGRSWGSMLGDPNDLALVLLFPVSFAFNRALAQGPARWPALLVLCALVAAVLATQSRGGLLGICAVVGISVFSRYRLPKWVWLLMPVLLMLLLSVAGVAERQSGGAAESGIDESAMGRIYAWQAAISMGLSHPLFGVGLDNFYVNYYFHSPHWDGKNHAVHSSWFQVLAEAGVLGLILFVSFVIGLIRRSYSLIARGSLTDEQRVWLLAIHSGIASFAVSGTFLTQAFTWPLYILAALLWAYHRILTPTPVTPGYSVSISCDNQSKRGDSL